MIKNVFMGVVNGRRGNGITGMNLLSESLESLQKLPNEAKDEKEDEANLLETLQEQGDRGNAIAQFSLAKVCLKEGDTSRALSYLHSAAQQGDFQAMYQLAVMKYEGMCTEQSYLALGRRV
jgi:TPR repeat protein